MGLRVNKKWKNRFGVSTFYIYIINIRFSSMHVRIILKDFLPTLKQTVNLYQSYLYLDYTLGKLN